MATFSVKALDAALSANAQQYGFRIEGNFLVFDKTSDLSYRPVEHYSLRDLLTVNPLCSYTKLSKSLLIRLAVISDSFVTMGLPVPKVVSSYRSKEFSLLDRFYCLDGSDGLSVKLQYDSAHNDLIDYPDAPAATVVFYPWGCCYGVSKERHVGKVDSINRFQAFFYSDTRLVFGAAALSVFIIYRFIKSFF